MRDDSSEYLHARSTPTSSATGQDFCARPKQSAAEVHYLPMDGSVKLKTRGKDTENRGAKLKMTWCLASVPTIALDAHGGRRRDLGHSDSFSPVVYANQTGNAIESADETPEETDFDLSGIIDSPEFSSQSDGDTQLERKVNKQTDDYRKSLHARRTPAPDVAGQDTGARPKQFKGAAEVHYLPMDGSAKLKPRRKERGRAKPRKSGFLASVPTLAFKNTTFSDTDGGRGRGLILSDSFRPAVYASQQKIATESVEYVPQEADFDLSGIVDSPEFASQSPGDTQIDRIIYDKTGEQRSLKYRHY